MKKTNLLLGALAAATLLGAVCVNANNDNQPTDVELAYHAMSDMFDTDDFVVTKLECIENTIVCEGMTYDGQIGLYRGGRDVLLHEYVHGWY